MGKISALPTDTVPDGADYLPFVDATAGRTERTTFDNLAASDAFTSRYVAAEVVEYIADPTDQHAEIVAKIAAAVQSGRPVFFPEATYEVDDTIDIASPVRLVGVSCRRSIIALADGANCNLFEVATTVTGFELENIGLEGNSANNTSGSGIVFLAETTPATYRGTGRCSSLRITDFADDGLFCGEQRHAGAWTDLISGGNGRYGVNLDQCQDHQFTAPNIGTNTDAGFNINGSNNVITGGSVYGGTNLVILGAEASKTLFSGTVLEASQQHAVVINIDAADDVSTPVFAGCSIGRIGLAGASTYRAFYSATAKRLQVSGHIYKRTADTAPTYLFDVPATCRVNVGSLLVQPGAFTTALSVNGTDAFEAGEWAPVGFSASQFSVVGTTATVTHISGILPIISFPAATNSSAGINVDVPRSWATFAVYIKGVNFSSGSGNTAFRLTWEFTAAGGTLGSPASSGSTITAAGAQNVEQTIQIGTAVTNVPGSEFHLRVDRRSASDTLANAWAMTSALLVRLT
jgi:hypothetical protein